MDDTQIKTDDTNTQSMPQHDDSVLPMVSMDEHAPAFVNSDSGEAKPASEIATDEATSDTEKTDSQSTDEVRDARETLKAALQIGLTVQMVSVVTAFAIKTGKEDFLKKLNDLILELHGTLDEEEKRQLQDDTNAMMEQKAEELVTSLGEDLSSEELEQVVGEIKNLAQNDSASS